MDIALIQHGPADEMLVEMSLLIGLKKQHPNSRITWIGEPCYFDLVKYNHRIDQYLDIYEAGNLHNLPKYFKADLCINPSLNKPAKQIASLSNAKIIRGFNNDGPADQGANFFANILTRKLSTNKTILDLFYNLAGLHWKGEGYGLSYYPKTKQSKTQGIYLQDHQSFSLPLSLLPKFDTINQFAEIITDDLFVAHASLALRKKVTINIEHLDYKIHLFNSRQKELAS